MSKDKLSRVLGAIALIVAVIAIFIGLGTTSGPSRAGGTTNLDALTLDSGNLTLTSGNIAVSAGGLTVAGGSTVLATTTTARLIQGGALLASSTSATAITLRQADLLGYKGIAGTYSGGAMTYTLPATSTLTTFIPNAGDSAEFWLFPTTGNVVVAAGAGIDLENSSTTATDLTITAGNSGRLMFIRKTNTDVFATFQEFMDAD